MKIDHAIAETAKMFRDSAKMQVEIEDARVAWVLGTINDQRFCELVQKAAWGWIAERHV